MDIREQTFQVLPDLLKEGLRLIICGTAVAEKSAQQKCYYAGRGNKFWGALFEAGLTGELLGCEQYRRLLEWGIGLMDLAKKKSGCDGVLRDSDYDIDGTFQKVCIYQPGVLCFNGKEAARVFLRKGKTKEIELGLQTSCIGKTRLYVAPSTSGAAKKHWKQSYWSDLARLV